VLLFAVVKFTEGAWLIVIIFPVLVYALIRLNRQYRAEAACLASDGPTGPQAQPPNYSRRVVLLLVDDYDLAAIAALRRTIRNALPSRGPVPCLRISTRFSGPTARLLSACRSTSGHLTTGRSAMRCCRSSTWARRR